MKKIKDIVLRKILNSGGKYTIQAEIVLTKNIKGIASAPSAIIPGRREVETTNFDSINSMHLDNLKKQLLKLKNPNQMKVDNILENNIETLGSDLCLSISLAFARASANYYKVSLINYIEKLSGIKSEYKAPIPLVAIFSGGVHGELSDSLQQIMLLVNEENFDKAVSSILKVYDNVENFLKKNNYFLELGASSGFITKNLSVDEQFNILNNTIKKFDLKNSSIGIDVAAEHLIVDNFYYYQGKKYDIDSFYNLINDYKMKYRLSFIEDPFDSDADEYWIKFKNSNSEIAIVGDDLFATQSKFINSTEANTIIIKMNQAGTLSKTIDAIIEAKKQGVKLCVSHRSLETEDTFMCDLAVATNSDFIKIGGPRRGDRIAKYNRLLSITK